MKDFPYSIPGPGDKLMELIKTKKISLKSHDLDILDIGFNNPCSFILFYHQHGLKTYKGIDEIASFSIPVCFPGNIPIPEEAVFESNESPYNRYKFFHKTLLKDTALLEIDFNKVFQFRVNIKIQDYFNSEDFKISNPNFIILSQFLHLFSDKKEAEDITDMVLAKLPKDGIIWIKVFSSDQKLNSYTFPYTPNEIAQLESKMKVIYKEEKDYTTLLVGMKN